MHVYCIMYNVQCTLYCPIIASEDYCRQPKYFCYIRSVYKKLLQSNTISADLNSNL